MYKIGANIMANSKKLNKKGFGYIVAIGMLALLAFMGFFLMQSSATEYSQCLFIEQ